MGRPITTTRTPTPSASSRALAAALTIPEIAGRVEAAIAAKRIDKGTVSRLKRHLGTPDLRTATVLQEVAGVPINGWRPDGGWAIETKGAA